MAATTETLLSINSSQPAEDAIADGSLTTTACYGYYAKYSKGFDVLVAPESDGSTNKIFKINGSCEVNNGSSLVALRPVSLSTQSTLNKFTSKIMLPSVDDADAMTGVHQPHKAWGASSPNYSGYGVFLTGGGAMYYDYASSSMVNFIAPGTMSANKWYRVESIMDTSEGTNSSATSKVYMNAFVYAADTNELIGTSGWQYVSNYELPDSSAKCYRNILIQAWRFDEGSYVFADDFNLYSVNDYNTISCVTAEYNENNTEVVFTFSEDIENGVITASNVCVLPDNPSLKVDGKYSVTILGNTVSVDLSNFPYNESFTVQIASYIMDSVAECEGATPEDPFENAVTSVDFAPESAGETADIIAGDNVIATVNLINESNEAKEYMIIVTSWNSNNECVAIRNVCGTIEIGEDDAVILPAVPFEDEGSIIRVSLVDNWYNLIPVGDAVTFESGGN